MSSVIFNSYLDKDKKELKKNDTLFFTADVNEGKHYDETSGTFVAPLKGWYCFFFTVGTSDEDTNAAVALQINSKIVAYAVTDKPHVPLAISQGTNQAIVLMNPKDTAKVVGYDHNSFKLQGGNCTTFSGYRVQQQ